MFYTFAATFVILQFFGEFQAIALDFSKVFDRFLEKLFLIAVNKWRPILRGGGMVRPIVTRHAVGMGNYRKTGVKIRRKYRTPFMDSPLGEDGVELGSGYFTSGKN